ncbi:MAG: ABC transporter permease [Acidimicrobiia bacterium]|nr:ABC transporter permease [Acidimicrobiia bacterium]
MLAALRYAVEEASASLWRGRRTAWLSIGTIAVAVFVLGTFLLVTVNLEHMADEWRQAAELSVFLDDELTEEERRAIEALFAPGPVVTSHEFVSKADALARFKQMFGELAAAAGTLESNPIPASFEVRVRADAPTQAMEALVTRLRATPGVSDVRYDREWLDRLVAAAALVRRVGLVLGTLLTVAAALTVGNVVRLALYARHDEVDIMELVGAPRAYVKGPFVTEGVLQGGLGALVRSWRCSAPSSRSAARICCRWPRRSTFRQ